jgi:hypothetical protein
LPYVFNAVLVGIIRDATAAPARDGPAQMSMIVRNPNRNARKIDSRISARICI